MQEEGQKKKCPEEHFSFLLHPVAMDIVGVALIEDEEAAVDEDLMGNG